MPNARLSIWVSRVTATGKEFRVLPSNGHRWENSSQVTGLLWISDLNLWHVSVSMWECVIRTTTNTHGHNDIDMQELSDVMHKQPHSSETLSKRKMRYSGHQLFVVCWNGSCRGATVSSPHSFGQSRSIQWLLPKQSSYENFCYLRFKQSRKSFPSLQGFLYPAVREIGN